jgi:hypothetical protein
MWLAGNQGPTLSPVVWWLVVTVLALAFGTSALVASARRRREEPLRNEIQGQPVTFRSAVDVKANVLGTMTAQRGPLYLVVHGDVFQVSHPFPVARFLFGQDYCYRAQDSTVEMIPGALHDWIEISGQPAESAARIWIGRRKLNRQLWDVLVSAGAHPIGSPPAPLAALAALDVPGSGPYGWLTPAPCGEPPRAARPFPTVTPRSRTGVGRGTSHASRRARDRTRPGQLAVTARLCTARHSTAQDLRSSRAMTMRWIWLVPSKICGTLASRM